MPRRSTLERNVKRMITGYLDQMVEAGWCYYRMSVPVGYGKSGIDYEGCMLGHFFGIEAKSPDPDADLTPRQRQCCVDIHNACGAVFIISSDEGLRAFSRWVMRCSKASVR